MPSQKVAKRFTCKAGVHTVIQLEHACRQVPRMSGLAELAHVSSQPSSGSACTQAPVSGGPQKASAHTSAPSARAALPRPCAHAAPAGAKSSSLPSLFHLPLRTAPKLTSLHPFLLARSELHPT